MGPEPRGDAWWVARVDAVIPGRDRTFEEVHEEVSRRWFSQEAERKTIALATRLRKAGGIVIERGSADALAEALRAFTPSSASDVNGR